MPNNDKMKKGFVLFIIKQFLLKNDTHIYIIYYIIKSILYIVYSFFSYMAKLNTIKNISPEKYFCIIHINI